MEKERERHEMPDELWASIFGLSPVCTAIGASVVCRRWARQLRDNALWKHYCERDRISRDYCQFNRFLKAQGRTSNTLCWRTFYACACAFAVSCAAPTGIETLTSAPVGMLTRAFDHEREALFVGMFDEDKRLQGLGLVVCLCQNAPSRRNRTRRVLVLLGNFVDGALHGAGVREYANDIHGYTKPTCALSHGANVCLCDGCQLSLGPIQKKAWAGLDSKDQSLSLRAYSGDWMNGKPHGFGQGTFESLDRVVFKGLWRQGQPYGVGAVSVSGDAVLRSLPLPHSVSKSTMNAIGKGMLLCPSDGHLYMRPYNPLRRLFFYGRMTLTMPWDGLSVFANGAILVTQISPSNLHPQTRAIYGNDGDLLSGTLFHPDGRTCTVGSWTLDGNGTGIVVARRDWLTCVTKRDARAIVAADDRCIVRLHMFNVVCERVQTDCHGRVWHGCAYDCPLTTDIVRKAHHREHVNVCPTGYQTLVLPNGDRMVTLWGRMSLLAIASFQVSPTCPDPRFAGHIFVGPWYIKHVTPSPGNVGRTTRDADRNVDVRDGRWAFWSSRIDSEHHMFVAYVRAGYISWDSDTRQCFDIHYERFVGRRGQCLLMVS